MFHYRLNVTVADNQEKESESAAAQCDHCHRWAPIPKDGPVAAVLYSKTWKQILMNCSGMGEKGVNHLSILVHTGSTEQYHGLPGIASFIILLINGAWSEDKALMFLNKWLFLVLARPPVLQNQYEKGLITTEYIVLC